MTKLLEENVTHTAGRNTTTATQTDARIRELIGAHLGSTHVRFSGEDIQHARTEIGQLGKDTCRLGPVEWIIIWVVCV